MILSFTPFEWCNNVICCCRPSVSTNVCSNCCCILRKASCSERSLDNVLHVSWRSFGVEILWDVGILIPARTGCLADGGELLADRLAVSPFWQTTVGRARTRLHVCVWAGSCSSPVQSWLGLMKLVILEEGVHKDAVPSYWYRIDKHVPCFAVWTPSTINWPLIVVCCCE